MEYKSASLLVNLDGGSGRDRLNTKRKKGQ